MLAPYKKFLLHHHLEDTPAGPVGITGGRDGKGQQTPPINKQ